MDILKRKFDNWRYVIWDMFGISIVNENRGEYSDYIENEEDISKNGLRSWLYNTFCVSNALANSQSIKDSIVLEYVPSGQECLQTIIEAMKDNRSRLLPPPVGMSWRIIIMHLPMQKHVLG